MRKFLHYILFFIILIPVTILLFAVGVKQGLWGDLPDKEAISQVKNETASLVYSADGELLGKFFAKNRTNIQYHDFPPHIIHALIATEDARFFEHSGVDYKSLMRVFLKTLLLGDERAGGGSTISQQLAKNLYGRPGYGWLSMPVNKVKEVIIAGRIEEVYSKEEVLTLYLNTVPFGENVFGAEAAALRFFNKPVHLLNIEESAVLIGLLKANTYYNPRLNPENAVRRRNVVLSRMEKYGYLSTARFDSISALPLKLDYANHSTDGPANYFLPEVKREATEILNELNQHSSHGYDIEKDGLVITTTLNAEMQKLALVAMNEHFNKMQPLLRAQYNSGISYNKLKALAEKLLKEAGKDAGQIANLPGDQAASNSGLSVTALDSAMHQLTLLHGGLITMNPQTGEILTYVGGIDYRSQPYDQIKASRQLASAFKPLLFAAALEDGIDPCTYLSNDRLVFNDFNNWSPQNYDRSFGGSYSMAGALTKSMNIPSVNLYQMTDRTRLNQLWSALGFSRPLPEAPSAALGTGEASALELCMAYAALANGGYKVNPTTIEKIENEHGEVIYHRKTVKTTFSSVISAKTSLLLQHMMKRVVSEGTAASLPSRYGIVKELAAKTGTSQDYADAWFGCYTPGMVTIARVGAQFPEIHFNSGRLGSGSALALPWVGLYLQSIQHNSDLADNLFSPFPHLPESLYTLLTCDDYQETSDSFFDIFNFDRNREAREERRKERQKMREEQKKELKEERKKGGILERLFRKKNQ